MCLAQLVQGLERDNIYFTILGILGCATYTDLRWRKIPNFIPILILLVAFYIHYINSTWLLGLYGLAIAGVLFVPYIFNQAGGGDVKIFLALGFFLGLGVIFLLLIVLTLLALFFILRGSKRVPLAPFILFGYLIIGGVVFATKIL